jgi:hypothetical protein
MAGCNDNQVSIDFLDSIAILSVNLIVNKLLQIQFAVIAVKGFTALMLLFGVCHYNFIYLQ